MMRSILVILVGLIFTACAAEPPAVPLPDKNTTVAKTPDSGTTQPASSSRGPISTNPSSGGLPTPSGTDSSIPKPQTTPTDKPSTPTSQPGGSNGTPTTPTNGGGTTTPPPSGGTTTPTSTPPSSETPKTTAQGFWVSSTNGEYPSGAVSGGSYNGEGALICRVKTSSGSYAPGTLLPSEGVCFYTLGTAGQYSAQYEVLAVSGGAATSILDFAAASNGSVPARAIKGGDSGGRDVAVCAVSTSYGVAYGQVGEGDPGCIFYGLKADGEAVAVYLTSYWVLVAK